MGRSATRRPSSMRTAAKTMRSRLGSNPVRNRRHQRQAFERYGLAAQRACGAARRRYRRRDRRWSWPRRDGLVTEEPPPTAFSAGH
jgi:hypothetical protein